MGVMACTRFQLQWTKLYNEDKLWPAQDFGFRGDNYITKKVSVVFLACDMPTGPPLHPYQILSNYLKQYGSYGLHKISASVEKTI